MESNYYGAHDCNLEVGGGVSNATVSKVGSLVCSFDINSSGCIIIYATKCFAIYATKCFAMPGVVLLR